MYGFRVGDVIFEDIKIEMGWVVLIVFLVFNVVVVILFVIVLELMADKFGCVKVYFVCIVVMVVGYFSFLVLGISLMLIYVLMGVVGVGWVVIVSLFFVIML